MRTTCAKCGQDYACACERIRVGACESRRTPAEHELLEAVCEADMTAIFVAMSGSHPWDDKEHYAVNRVFAAARALREERKPKPKWRADRDSMREIVGPHSLRLIVDPASTKPEIARDHIVELLNKADPA